MIEVTPFEVDMRIDADRWLHKLGPTAWCAYQRLLTSHYVDMDVLAKYLGVKRSRLDISMKRLEKARLVVYASGRLCVARQTA